jgi:antitoxin YefM
MRILPIAEVKAKLNQLVADVAASDEAVTITRNGRAAAVLVSHEEFESWKETVDIVADPEFVAEIRKGIADLKKGRGKTVRTPELDTLFAVPPNRRRRSG